jgi:hypothetical protein
MRNYLVIIFVFVSCAISALAQDTASVELRKAEMKKLEKLAGQWKGSGWSQYGPKKEPFSGAELVQKKVDGLALLIEGKFNNSEGRVIHETLAVMAYDDKARAYKFNTFLASGGTGLYDLKMLPDGYEWGFQVPSGTVRFIIKIENDTWFEIGEFSRDGKTWFRNFEMKLEKVK